jgi:hypothetical protein
MCVIILLLMPLNFATFVLGLSLASLKTEKQFKPNNRSGQIALKKIKFNFFNLKLF